MNKYKVGQRVKIIRTGKKGIIKFVDAPDFSDYGYSHVCYSVEYGGCANWFTVHDIELIEEILDEKEKEYLSNIVKPFRDRVKHIQKLQSSTDKREYIEIKIRHDSDINLPYFNENTMYKEMELGKEYTLEELGI